MNIRKWGINRKLWLLSSFLILNAVVITAVDLKVTHEISAQMDDVARVQVRAIRAVGTIDMYHDALRGVLYRSLIDEDSKAVREEINDFRKEMLENVDVLTKLPLEPETRKEFDKVAPEISRYTAMAVNLVEKALDGDKSAVRAKLANFGATFEKLEVDLKKASDRIQKDADDRISQVNAAEHAAKRFNLIFLAFSIFGGFGISFLLIRNLVGGFVTVIRDLERETDSIAGGAGKIGGASQNLSSTATEQAAAIVQTVSSMEEMTSMLAQTSQQASRSMGMVEDNRGQVEQGKQVVTRMNQAMEEIHASNVKLEGIVRLIEEIKSKTKIINDIVFQTRLLSFNASIEAARAGSHGKGFSVVAEEVGKLASLSGKAADEIRTLLESSTQEVASVVRGTQDRVSLGKSVAQECNIAFQAMGTTFETLGESVKVIANAAREQEAGIKQTNRAMAEMDQVTQRNSQNAELLAGEATTLTHAARILRSNLVKVRGMIIGGEEFKSAPAADSNAAASVSATSSMSANVAQAPVSRSSFMASSGDPDDNDPSSGQKGSQRSRWKTAA